MSFKKKIFIFILFINSFNFSSADAQKKESNIFKIIWGDVKTSVNDGICTYTSPVRFSSNDWIKTAATILTTAAFMPLDKDIRKEFSKNHNSTKDNLSDFGNAYGNALTPVIAGTGIYTYGLLFKNDYVRETGRMVLEAVLFASIITDFSKVIVGRSRPYVERGPYFYKMLQFDSEFFSIPSGHSTVAFAMSSVLANRLKNVYATIGLYSLSTIAALSRIYTDKHWASDVVIGSAIGYFIGDYISSDNNKCTTKSKVSYNIYPAIGGLGLLVCF